ncbi:MAG TPA: ferrous iron transport protein B [Candidatus Limnocylindrales bacterium]|nr:ferrous iron transport protein B [Candidatus Limnocylindrales bacterium]
MTCHPVALPQDEAPDTSYRTVAVVGPPNSGKTTLFNRLTGLRQKVGNFPGVTVEHHTGYIRDGAGEEVALIDLPGIYSLTAKSEDEKVAIAVLQGNMPGMNRPDAVIVVLNSTNLHSHLVLAGRVIALGLPTLVLLNMADELHKQDGGVDVLSLARQLGTPVALVSATTGAGLEAVTNFLSGASPALEPMELPVIGSTRSVREWAVRVGENANYRRPATPIWTSRLDNVFLNRTWGPVIFAVVVIAVFQTIFAVGQPLSNLLQKFLDVTGSRIGTVLPDGMFRSLLINGVWKGTGSVLVFLPQILLLFLVIGILEDSGYLARAAVIADRTMSRVGLNGKSFIPLLSAYACAVPAIMATRTIESKRDRIATILIAPFMTCSARLPVYTMVIAAFLPNRPLLGPFLGTRAVVMLSLYLLGFLMAVLTARLLKSTVLRSKDAPFILEMPPYRWPKFSSLMMRLVDRGKAFLYRAGTVIMLVSLLLWAATNFPMHNGQPPAIQDSVVASLGHAIEPVIRPLGFDWKIGVGLVTSLAAREVIIATLGTLNGIDAESHSFDLQNALRHELTIPAAIALLVFFAFAMQCMSTIAVVRRETNGWKWPAIQFTYMTVVAYVSAFAAFNIAGYFIH